MKRCLKLLTPFMLLALAAPAFAGDYGACTAGTQECLDMMVSSVKERGWVGLEFAVDEKTHQMSVKAVVQESPALDAGFEAGDVMLAMNGIAYAEENAEAMQKEWMGMHPGSKCTFTVKRDGKKMDLGVTLAAMPEEVMARMVGAHMIDHAMADASHQE